MAIQYKNRSGIARLKGADPIKVTPDMAKEWLKLNTSNRPLSDRHIKDLASRMDRGEWMMNGQSIIFSSTGDLIDGQHRLHAVILHGQPVEFMVVFGVAPSAFNTLDEGRRRSAGDLLSLHGVKNPTNVAATIKKIIAEEKAMNINSVHANAPVSNMEAFQWYNQNREVSTTVADAHALYDKGGNQLLSVSELAHVLWAVTRSHTDEGHAFCESLATGIGIPSSRSPIFLVRNRLVMAKINKSATLTQSYKRGIIAKAWNAHMEGREMHRLTYSPTAEGFIRFAGFPYNTAPDA